MIEDNTLVAMTKLMKGPALAAFSAKMPLLVQVMQKPVKTEEDKLIRAAVAYIVAEVNVLRVETNANSSAGVAGSPDDSGSGA